MGEDKIRIKNGGSAAHPIAAYILIGIQENDQTTYPAYGSIYLLL
jgi:hypothetical protein